MFRSPTMSSTTFDVTQQDFSTIVPEPSGSHDNAVSVTSHDDDNLTSLEPIVFYPIVKQPVVMIVVYSVAYGVVFLLGVVGNTLVVTVIARNPQMHSVTYFFIVNLAVADILVGVFCLPITLISNLLSGWHCGALMCKLFPFLQGVSVSASVNTLAAISLDRYLAICHLLEFRMTRKVARLVIVFTWACAAAIMVPWLVYYRLGEMSNPVQTVYICYPEWPSEAVMKGYFLGVIFLSCYTVPLLLISVFYALVCFRVWHRDSLVTTGSEIIHRSKVKVLKMLIVVVILFALSWLPLYAVNMRLYFGPALVHDDVEFNFLQQIVIPVAQWLGSSNSCVNPIVYCLFSRKFRVGVYQLIHCIRWFTRPPTPSGERTYLAVPGCGTRQTSFILTRRQDMSSSCVGDGRSHSTERTLGQGHGPGQCF